MIALFSPLARGEMITGWNHSQGLDDNSQVLNVGESSTLSGVCQDRRTPGSRWGPPSQEFGANTETLSGSKGWSFRAHPLHADPVHTRRTCGEPMGTDQARILPAPRMHSYASDAYGARRAFNSVSQTDGTRGCDRPASQPIAVPRCGRGFESLRRMSASAMMPTLGRVPVITPSNKPTRAPALVSTPLVGV
jgi:hypothetical protein